MKKLLLILILLISIMQVSAIEIFKTSTICDEHGILEMKVGDNRVGTVYTEDFKVFARRQGEIDFKELTGKWDSTRLEQNDNIFFKSNIVQLRHKAVYDLKLKYLDINKEEKEVTSEVTCPGLLYNCELFNITIEQCYTKDNEFTAYLYLGGSVPSENIDIIKLDPKKDFDYYFKAESSFEDTNNNIAKTGALPLNSEITYLGMDRYLLKAPMSDNVILSLKVAYSPANMGECPENFNIPDALKYDATYCEIEEKPITAITGEAVKEIPEVKKDYTPFYIIGGCILVGLLIIAFIVKKVKNNIT